MDSTLSSDDLATRAEDVATALLGKPTQKSRGEWRWGRRGSLSLCRTGSKRGVWFDHERGEGGDLIDLIRRERGVCFKEALELGAEIIGSNVRYTPPSPRAASEDDAVARTTLALRLWDETVPLKGTLGERYLTTFRRIDTDGFDLDHCVRWNPRIRAVVALMTDPHTGNPCGVHRSFLNGDGSKRCRKMLGRQGAVCLTPYEDVTTGLGIAEGIEDALAVLVSGWTPIWAAASAGAIARFPILAGINSLAVFADADDAGTNAARACCARWQSSEREVRVVAPGRGA